MRWDDAVQKLKGGLQTLQDTLQLYYIIYYEGRHNADVALYMENTFGINLYLLKFFYQNQAFTPPG